MVFTATTSQPVDAMRARAFDRDLATFRLDATRWQTLLGIDLDTRPGSYTVSFEATSAGQSITRVPPVPSWLQRYTEVSVSPAQYSSSGGHTTQPRLGSQI